MEENAPTNIEPAKAEPAKAKHVQSVHADAYDLDLLLSGFLGETPPVGQLPPKGERQWVDRPEQLFHVATVLKQASLIAIDAEFTQVRSRTQAESGSSVPRLSLLQLAIANRCFVVDTLRLHDLSPLATVVGDPSVAVLLHGAGADLRVMAERGLEVAHYYDLEATSRSIFGQHESSLAAMLQRAFHIRLDKSLQRTDWTRRPLPPAMIAYAARDAEVTLALHSWLDQHYHDILALHENTLVLEPVASWIEPFLYGTAQNSPEQAIADAKAKGFLREKVQIYEDCRAALVTLSHPLRRSRLLRLIADLSLTKLAPDLEPLLQAPTSDERAASVRALGRLGIKTAKTAIYPLLHDPVQDVRKAAQTALRNLGEKELPQPRVPPQRSSDGTRSWIVETAETAETAAAANGSMPDENDWKARLRSMMRE